jgi:hypothetical protein
MVDIIQWANQIGTFVFRAAFACVLHRNFVDSTNQRKNVAQVASINVRTSHLFLNLAINNPNYETNLLSFHHQYISFLRAGTVGKHLMV